ncbi:MAG: 50S ribosomal protein L15 [Candidatus Latescibacteria bacterium]|nr:50S ribosomal protein L15 [bacterium]MBD3425439.1 50S ribosomal protein L15 [Candidatus Latescibacterota bacterium]
MKLNELKPPRGAVKRRKRLGRGTGSGRGDKCTRGDKGQNSRSGGGVPPWFEGGQMPLQRRIPKRGFTNIFKKHYQIVNIDKLESHFEKGEKVTRETLEQKNMIDNASRPVKVLGRGKISKSLDLEVDRISKSAARAIKEAGGSVSLTSGEELPGLNEEESR